MKNLKEEAKEIVVFFILLPLGFVAAFALLCLIARLVYVALERWL